MTDKEFFETMSERGYKTKKSIADAFDIPYTTVSKWGCSSTAPDYVKKLILTCIDLTSTADSLHKMFLLSESELNLNSSDPDKLKIELSLEQFNLLCKLIGSEIFEDRNSKIQQDLQVIFGIFTDSYCSFIENKKI